MLTALLDRLWPRRITTAAALGEFLASRAALVTQKVLIGYCHARTLLPMNELMRDRVFAEAYETARRLSYYAVLADLYVIAEGRLRSHCGVPWQLVEPLVALHAAGARRIAESTAADVERSGSELRRRLSRVQAVPPASIGEISNVSADLVYAAMPIHERLRRADEPAIRASVRFMLVGLAPQFDSGLDNIAIVAELTRSGELESA